MIIKNEIWKIIDGFDIKTGMYSVSNLGNVKNNFTNKILKPWQGKNGYLFVSLMSNKNKPTHIGIHRLVATAFIDIPDSLLDINEPLVPNHNDFDKTNNNVDNLAWMTYAMNNDWNIKHNHCKIGEDTPNAKVSNKTVHNICQLLQDGKSNSEIADVLNMDIHDQYIKSLITRIRNGSEWKSISSNYNITIKNSNRVISDDMIRKICELLEKGYSTKEIRRELNIQDTNKRVFKNLVTGIRLRRSYKDISKDYYW